MWPLTFISQQDFYKHVEDTIKSYGDTLEPYDINKLNSNVVDPIKLIFDKIVYNLEWDEVIRNEIFRQRDKSNNNIIGNFHQNIFQYIQGCEVPAKGWDVIFAKNSDINISGRNNAKVYIEMKNKHNTMNSSSSSSIYKKMYSQICSEDNCVCLLVEVIAEKSQNITWKKTIDGEKREDRRIRRMSIDKFYELVTGEKDAFFQVCKELPKAIKKIVSWSPPFVHTYEDSAYDDLANYARIRQVSLKRALFLLGFSDYEGFISTCGQNNTSRAST